MASDHVVGFFVVVFCSKQIIVKGSRVKLSHGLTGKNGINHGLALCVKQVVVSCMHSELIPFRRISLFLFQTYIGSILVSVNPYKMYNIYGTDHVLQYEGKALGENPP